ncbi:MAG: hypothetical protein JWN53_713, partial [Gemmatimonadetes bacterium]|nr:hypothetical protein [Gemmatimonadota bacterium]
MMVAAFAAAVSHPLAGQRLGAPVERPPLREAVDTNDAQAYFDAGLESFDIDPERAAAAFYWAARLNPAWGEPLYARRAALLMTDTHLMRQMFERNGRSDGSPEVRRLDSLQFRALMLAPFLYRRLDQRMFMAYMRDAVIKSTRGGAVPNRVVIDFQIEQYLRQAGPLMRAWVAYGGGNFTGALDDYAFALSSARDKPGIHLERGRIFGMRGQVDSAVAEMQAALAQLANEDRDKLVVFYESKAMAEYSIGTLLEGAG